MTASCREQFPLLHDDLSEEEHFTLQRRGRMALRNRVRHKVKGAAFIFRRWPGYWSTALTYMWIALGMIAIVTLLTYNGITVFAMIPSETESPFYSVNKNIEKFSVERTSPLPDIFMHVHMKKGNTFDINKYLPYIEILSKQYKNYNYHLVIVINDKYILNDDVPFPEDSKFNEIALNTILGNSNGRQKKVNGLNIEQIYLTEYLDSSPIKKHWRHIPDIFIEFFVRAVSIWDKGGIAFNPIILTPYSPQAFYIDKIKAILKSYPNDTYSKNEENDSKHNVIKDNGKRKLNNIRDIIDAMEQNDENDVMKKDVELTSLETAETRFLNPVILNLLNDTKMVLNKISSSLLHNKDDQKLNDTEKLISQESETSEKQAINSQSYEIVRVGAISETSTTSTKGGLPLVLKKILNEKKLNENTTGKNTRNRKSVININQRNTHNKHVIKDDVIMNAEFVNDTYKPMIVPANITSNNLLTVTKSYITSETKNYPDQLTIDIKGNILATKTPCHAFIGTLFSDVVHFDPDESVTMFLIRELSVFCNGLLSSCNGIDVIFL